MQRGGRHDRLLQGVEHAVGERATLGIGARRVNETKERDLAARVARERLRTAVDPEHPALGRRHDAMECVRARRGRNEVRLGERFALMCAADRRAGKRGKQRDRPRRAPDAARTAHLPAGAERSAFEPSFMWWARPSFSLVKSTSNFCESSLPSHAKPRRNCSLSAPPLSQFASRDEVMYTRLPSQLWETMLTCLPVAFS